ncbi:hypothetical protein F2Q70_00044970 [Brassica cretica]|uniref:Uncharacterized protein n=1 Tax=Brassica cretica TaxID=69181 RepID=A0A8S9KKH0_BRACR|nr:hypothetical protein F2Q70_00044970 [Brassica cretica]
MQSSPLFAHVSGQYLHFLPTLDFVTVEKLQLWFQQLKFQFQAYFQLPDSFVSDSDNRCLMFSRQLLRRVASFARYIPPPTFTVL